MRGDGGGGGVYAGLPPSLGPQGAARDQTRGLRAPKPPPNGWLGGSLRWQCTPLRDFACAAWRLALVSGVPFVCLLWLVVTPTSLYAAVYYLTLIKTVY